MKNRIRFWRKKRKTINISKCANNFFSANPRTLYFVVSSMIVDFDKESKSTENDEGR